MNTKLQSLPARPAAFFDVDDTLINVKSMLSFQRFWFEQFPDTLAERCYDDALQTYHREDVSWEFLNRLYYRHFAGRNEALLLQTGQLWFERESLRSNFYQAHVLEALKRHQNAGTEVVFVSGSFGAVLQPLADVLGVNYILATQFEVVDGFLTGEILSPQTIGQGKRDAILNFSRNNGIDLSQSFAYGDDISDLPMLETVGYPYVVSGGRSLVDVGRTRGWPILDIA